MSRLVIILSLFFCIYGLAHLYFLVKARRAFYLDGVHYVLLFAILTFLLLAPVNARLLELQGQLVPSVILYWVGYGWMGFVFIFVCLALPVDGYHLLMATGQQLFNADWTALMLSKRQSIALVTLATFAIMAYGGYEASQIRTESVTLRTDKIPAAGGPVRIVQVSDLHISPMFYPGRIDPILKLIQQAQPDILVSTGDMIDGHIFGEHRLTAALRSIPTKMGKFAVTGNHEYFSGMDRSAAFYLNAGFTLLQNESVSVTKEIVITGLDDPAGSREGKGPAEMELLGRIPARAFSLLLKHRPLVDPESQGNIDLQLSGHTHGGQIFPFDAVVRLRYPWIDGLQQFATERYLYTSRGTGTWGPPLRILAPPEITIIDLVPASPDAKRPRKAVRRSP